MTVGSGARSRCRRTRTRSCVATAGGLGLASAQGVLIVFDLRSGTEIRQIGLGRFDDETINGLSLSPEGDVAATVPVGDGSDVLLYSPFWDDAVRVLATGAQFDSVVTAGGRVAFVGGRADRDGVRVSVLSGDGAVVYRGPWVSEASALGFDGRGLAFRTGGCGYAGVVGAWESRLRRGLACARRSRSTRNSSRGASSRAWPASTPPGTIAACPPRCARARGRWRDGRARGSAAAARSVSRSR